MSAKKQTRLVFYLSDGYAFHKFISNVTVIVNA